jgi:AraC-like DNA-binding protein
MSKKSSKSTDTQGIPRRDVLAAERVSMAIELLKQRYTYDEIARRCGYSDRSAAHKAIQREMHRRIVPNVDEYRAQELDILDAIHQKVWDVALNSKDEDGNDKINLWAVDRLLEISKDRRKLLNLDVTTEQELSNQNYKKEIVLLDSTGGQDANS